MATLEERVHGLRHLVKTDPDPRVPRSGRTDARNGRSACPHFNAGLEGFLWAFDVSASFVALPRNIKRVCRNSRNVQSLRQPPSVRQVNQRDAYDP